MPPTRYFQASRSEWSCDISRYEGSATFRYGGSRPTRRTSQEVRRKGERIEALQGKSLSRYAAIMIAVAVLTALVIANLSGSGQEVTATHAPADKVVASGEELTPITEGTAVTIMSATLRTSKPTDLIMSVTLECAILTKLYNAAAGVNGGSSSASVGAQIDVWIEENGKIVPISSVSEQSQGPSAGGGEDDKVTFCQREEGRHITDTEDGKDGTDEQLSYHDAKRLTPSTGFFSMQVPGSTPSKSRQHSWTMHPARRA